MTEPNFFRQPGWQRTGDLLSSLWSLQSICQGQAASPEATMTSSEIEEAQRFQQQTVNAIRALAERVEQIAIAPGKENLIAANQRFRAEIETVKQTEQPSSGDSGYG